MRGDTELLLTTGTLGSLHIHEAVFMRKRMPEIPYIN